MRQVTRLRDQPLAAFGLPVLGGAIVPTTGQWYWVDPNAAVNVPVHGFGHGKSEDYPLETLAEAESTSESGDVIFVQGNIREENVVFSNLKFDRKVVGLYGLHHPDQPTSAYHPKSSMIRPPASPTATTPLIVVRGRGTQFHNITFDCPVDDTAVELVANASSGADEYDGSHAVFDGCLFQQGYRGIEDNGGTTNVQVRNSIFRIISVANGCAIVNTSTTVRVPQYWGIDRCVFPGNGQSGGNESHIDSPLSGSWIVDSLFGTVEGTGKYIDLTGGDDNTVTRNTLGGTYNTDDYVAGTNDLWLGNWVTVISTQAPNGFTVAAPAAP